jgi:cell fate (sporulation/competence/biofilm development) regulator YlbF (YheA/YmcA/DUF963 family)
VYIQDIPRFSAYFASKRNLSRQKTSTSSLQKWHGDRRNAVEPKKEGRKPDEEEARKGDP